MDEILEIVWCGLPALLFRGCEKRKESQTLLSFGGIGLRLATSRRMVHLGLSCILRRRRLHRGTRRRVLRVRWNRIVRRMRRLGVRWSGRVRHMRSPMYQGRRLVMCPRRLLRLLALQMV